MMEEVMVTVHNPNWIIEYDIEKSILNKQLGDILLGIEHIGSTAVPGLAAKPIIDIMVGINNLQALTKTHKERLAAIGYEFVDHPNFPERRFFRKGQWRAGTHHLHIYIYMAENWHANLLFRNYLIHHPEVMSEYGKLKLKLKGQFQNDRAGYTNAKMPFIQSILIKAATENDKGF
jgi:GrpB-like predicted nucleotidyltransferase (UPF0157 family)